MSQEIGVQPSVDAAGAALVQELRDARGAPSVHKATLASLRAYKADCFVFVCEGVDDKKVYFHWLKHLHFPSNYEFLVCNGKERLLQFRELLRRDVSGMGRDVYFIIDKDFDGLRGYQSGPDIFITETYSFENELVNREVLERVLAVELHCHGLPNHRAEILSKFEEVYASFLSVTRPHNHRIYLARHLKIDTRTLPNKLNRLAKVALLGVESLQENVNDIIVLAREPVDAEVGRWEEDFNALDPKREYRGKFALLFFVRWLDLLGKDRNSETPVLFAKAPKSEAVANGQLSLDSIAAKSVPPASLKAFVDSILAGRSHSASAVTPPAPS